MNNEVTIASMCAPSENVVSREIEGDVIIIPLTAGIGDADDELYTLNQTGKAIWQSLDGQRTLGEVAAMLALDFEAPGSELEADVVGFAREMVRRGLLTVAS